ncbi:four helix bundle protein [Patescibacteria group bacterium]|nr:MAG: four helix bundle protein [Patescibacteria group bacterium]
MGVEPSEQTFHQRLRGKMDSYVHLVYDLTGKFPSEEKFGVTSQLRRAALSVVLNYVEGFARFRSRVNKNFLEISFGSLKESEYLVDFSSKRGYCSREETVVIRETAREIGAMLWGILQRIE